MGLRCRRLLPVVSARIQVSHKIRILGEVALRQLEQEVPSADLIGLEFMLVDHALRAVSLPVSPRFVQKRRSLVRIAELPFRPAVCVPNLATHGPLDHPAGTRALGLKNDTLSHLT